MNEEILIRALIQKANEMNDDYLGNEKIVRMIMSKENNFENYEKINDFLQILAVAKENAQMSKRD